MHASGEIITNKWYNSTTEMAQWLGGWSAGISVELTGARAYQKTFEIWAISLIPHYLRVSDDTIKAVGVCQGK